jgi:Glutaredoxin-like domain (DUF836)
MKTLYLYTTLGCHLCEQAKSVAWPVMESLGYRLQEIEIADDPNLIEQYGVRIPVFAKTLDEDGLGWPFSEQQLAQYLRHAPA